MLALISITKTCFFTPTVGLKVIYNLTHISTLLALESTRKGSIQVINQVVHPLAGVSRSGKGHHLVVFPDMLPELQILFASWINWYKALNEVRPWCYLPLDADMSSRLDTIGAH